MTKSAPNLLFALGGYDVHRQVRGTRSHDPRDIEGRIFGKKIINSLLDKFDKLARDNMQDMNTHATVLYENFKKLIQ